MDSFELNKIAGGVLSALLVIFGTKTYIDIAQSSHGKVEKAGYTLPAPKDAPAASGSAPAAAAFDPSKVTALLAKASVENGQATFKKCASCHTTEKGGPNRVGPNLYNIIGRKGGAHEGFAYTDAMKAHPAWTYEGLATFIHNPKAAVPGTKMVFAGIADPGELADLIAFLRNQADSPAPLPK